MLAFVAWSGVGNAKEASLEHTELAGTLRITGNGPEHHLLTSLAHAFEMHYPTVSVDIFWHENAKPIRTVELGEADMGITGYEDSSLRSTTVARDGIAVITNFSNPVSELSLKQMSAVFSGNTRFWSQVYEEAPEMKIKLVNRADNQNIRQGFVNMLGIKRIPRTARMIQLEQHAINAVAGDLSAITFVSMAKALRAREDGVAINLLFIEKVEPEYQTVLDKTYPLQRPVIFITQPHPTPIILAFEQFTLSSNGQRIIKANSYYALSTE
ncbi:MAG: substrate-binding domain-containing protein [Nitrospirales bacterium]